MADGGGGDDGSVGGGGWPKRWLGDAEKSSKTHTESKARQH